MAFLLAAPLFLVLSAGAWILWRYRVLKRATRALLVESMPALPPAESLLAVRAEHLGTTLPGAGHMRFLAEGFGTFAVGELVLTGNTLSYAAFDRAVFAVPLAWVEEAALGRTANEGPLLRVAWQRAGCRLVTAFALAGNMHDAERWRKEIALRAGRAPPLPFLVEQPR